MSFRNRWYLWCKYPSSMAWDIFIQPVIDFYEVRIMRRHTKWCCSFGMGEEWCCCGKKKTGAAR